jgi:hypothetical protein
VWLTLLAGLGIGCRNRGLDGSESAGARSSSSPVVSAAPPANPSAEQDWILEQARDIGANPYGDAGDEGDAALLPSSFGSFSEAYVRTVVGRVASRTLRFRIAEWRAHPCRASLSVVIHRRLPPDLHDRWRA